MFAQNNASIEKNNSSNVKTSLLSDLILRDGILYDASFKPYTGKAILLHESNYYDISDMIGLESEFFIKDGIRNGQYIEFYPTGNNSIKQQGSYIHNMKDGTWKYYDKFKTMSKIENYKDGEKHGEWTVYNGSQIILIENYQFGKLHGERIKYYNKCL